MYGDSSESDEDEGVNLRKLVNFKQHKSKKRKPSYKHNQSPVSELTTKMKFVITVEGLRKNPKDGQVFFFLIQNKSM